MEIICNDMYSDPETFRIISLMRVQVEGLFAASAIIGNKETKNRIKPGLPKCVVDPHERYLKLLCSSTDQYFLSAEIADSPDNPVHKYDSWSAILACNLIVFNVPKDDDFAEEEIENKYKLADSFENITIKELSRFYEVIELKYESPELYGSSRSIESICDTEYNVNFKRCLVDEAGSMKHAYQNFVNLRNSALAIGAIKDPDTPANWIRWAWKKGYSVEHLRHVKGFPEEEAPALNTSFAPSQVKEQPLPEEQQRPRQNKKATQAKYDKWRTLGEMLRANDPSLNQEDLAKKIVAIHKVESGKDVAPETVMREALRHLPKQKREAF